MTGHQMNILEAKESKDAILNLWSYALKFLISMIRFSCIVVSEYPTGENMIELTVRFFFCVFWTNFKPWPSVIINYFQHVFPWCSDKKIRTSLSQVYHRRAVQINLVKFTESNKVCLDF